MPTSYQQESPPFLADITSPLPAVWISQLSHPTCFLITSSLLYPRCSPNPMCRVAFRWPAGELKSPQAGQLLGSPHTFGPSAIYSLYPFRHLQEVIMRPWGNRDFSLASLVQMAHAREGIGLTIDMKIRRRRRLRLLESRLTSWISHKGRSNAVLETR